MTIKLEDDECWSYDETDTSGVIAKHGERRDIEYIARGISKNQFIETIVSISHGSYGWIFERVSESGNETDVKIANKHLGKIVIIGGTFDKESGKVLKVLNPVKCRKKVKA